MGNKIKTGEINVRGEDGLLYLNESWLDEETGEVTTTSTLVDPQPEPEQEPEPVQEPVQEP